MHTRNFKNGNTNPALNDYEYDLNDFQVKDFEKVFYEETERSSMVKDRNKGIESITYNHLNLPTKITWDNNRYITYQYNAAGQKIKKTVEQTDSLKTVDYLDGFQYAGNQLQFFPTTEGYVKATPTDRTKTSYHYNYIYNYTDHLGNVRLSYTLDPEEGTLQIVDENHYYPFGLRHETHYPSGNKKDFRTNIGDVGFEPVNLVLVTSTEYNYKYNGFEYQDELDLNWYDYQARNYDPAIGRWMNIDPLAEMSRKTSPYVYTLNNPVFFIDPDGMKAEASSDSSGSGSNNSSSGKNEVSLGIAGIKLDLNHNVGAVSHVNYDGGNSSNDKSSEKNEADAPAESPDNGDPEKEKSLKGGEFDRQNFDDIKEKHSSYYSLTKKVLTNKEWLNYVEANEKHMDNTGNTMIGIGGFFGGKKMVTLKDLNNPKDLFKSFSVTTFLATSTIIQGQAIKSNASSLRDIGYNYNHTNSENVGKGVYIIDIRISAPAFGGMRSNSYHIYDKRTNTYLGSYKN